MKKSSQNTLAKSSFAKKTLFLNAVANISAKIKAKSTYKIIAKSYKIFALFALCIASVANLSLAKPITKEQSSKINAQIQEIQNNFKTKINNLESRLNITIEAERRNKDKTKNLSGTDYEILYRRFEDKKEHIKEMGAYHTKNTQDNAKKAKDKAGQWGLEREFGEVEKSLAKDSSSFVAQINEYKKRLDSLAKTQNHSNQKSAYKEKMEWIVQEFDNEYEDILFDVYSVFVEKISAILGEK